MANKGWIKLHRAIQDNSLWLEEPFTKGQAWVDLILLATHEDSEDGKYKKGCVYKSLVYLSQRWGWSRGKTRRYLEQLVSHQMIHRIVHPNGQVLTLINYGFYQYGEPTKKTPNSTPNSTPNEPHTRNKEIEDYSALPTAAEILYGGYK